MRVTWKTTKFFCGTHKGSTIEIEHEANGRFYIRVFNDRGYSYDGWAPENITTMREAKKEAIRGAMLDAPSAGVTAPCEECGGHGGFESIVGFDAHGPSHQWTPCQPCGGTGSVFSGAAPSKEPPCIQRFSGRGLSSLEASKQAQTDKSEIEPDGRK